MSPRRRNIIVGLVVLLGLGIATWMVLLFAGRFASLFASPGLPITMTSDRADGLSDGSSITYRGVPAGRVTGVRLRPDSQGVLITAEVNKKNPLPANLHAVIRTQSAFGNSAEIELELAGPPTGQLAAGANLTADYEGSALIPKQFTELAEDFRRQQLIQHLDQTVISIRQQSDRAGQLLNEVQNVVSNPKTREDLKATLANVRNATESAARVGSNLEKFTVKLDRIGNQTETTMSEVRVAVAKLGSSLDHFESISNKIDQGKGTAGLLVNDTKLYQGLVDTTKELNLTIADLQRVVQQWEQEGVTLKLAK
jgi:phospholipid/cholesterol/gamma-HCH transport system substrate-binding protein